MVFKKGQTAWNKGKELSKEHKEKVKRAALGHKLSKEHIEKIRLAHLGKPRSEETKNKISIGHKGKKNTVQIWNKGMTKETDNRIRISSERMAKTKKRLYVEGKIKPYPTEQRREIWKKKFAEGFKFPIPDEKHLARLREIRKLAITPKQDTKIEVKIQHYLNLLGIEYYAHSWIGKIEHEYQCDILIPSMNLVIECDGDYWHKYPIGRDIDRIRTFELIKAGFRVLRLWEHEIKVMNLQEFQGKMNDALK